MSLFKKPSTKGSKKFQVACTAKDKQPLKIKLSLVTSEERVKYRVPVYDYIL